MPFLVCTDGTKIEVDQDILERFGGFKWTASVREGGRVYAVRSQMVAGMHKTKSLHREILGVIGSQHVDHVDGNTLDCRRQNLRACHQKNNRKIVFDGETW